MLTTQQARGAGLTFVVGLDEVYTPIQGTLIVDEIYILIVDTRRMNHDMLVTNLSKVSRILTEVHSCSD